MCRNIKTLFNFEPPVTDDEVRAASLQFVRKLSGFNKPSKANEAAFERAVEQTTEVARELLRRSSRPRRRATAKSRPPEGARARARSARFWRGRSIRAIVRRHGGSR